MYKKCSKCKQEKLFSDFNKNRARKDGYHNQCSSCKRDYYKANSDKIISKVLEYYKENKDDILNYKRKYREENKIKLSEYSKKLYKEDAVRRCAQKQDYYEINKIKINKSHKEYRKVNKHKILALCNKRRAAKLNALPKWLTKAEHEEIKELYEIARMFKLYTGEEYHVDHIVPLQGENVCGLHVPWNLQVIPAKDNLSKSNKLQEEAL